MAADPLHAQEAQKQEFAQGSGFGNFGQRPDNSSFNSMPSNFGGSNSNWQSQSSIASAPDNSFSKSGGGNYPPGPIKYNGIPILNNTEVLSFLDNLQNTLRTSGFTEGAVGEIMQAMHVLARYNIMGLGLGEYNPRHFFKSL